MTAAYRPKGHIPDDAPHRLAVHVSKLVGMGAHVLPLVRLPARIDAQGGQDCSGSYGLLVETWCAARSLACPPLSRRFSYTLGRSITACDPAVPLIDTGAQPGDVVEGMRIIGVVPESLCPGDGPDVINERLPFADLEASWNVTQIGTIPDVGVSRCAAIRQALAARFPVGFGMQVDASYEQLVGEVVYTGPTGPSLGGHAQRIVGYRPGAFLIAGSWGEGFGDGGFVWIADEVIGNPDLCFDFYAVDVAPVVQP